MNTIDKYNLLESEYHEYDENAREVFAIIKRMIQEHLPEIEMEHTGSTSIGIGGKNIVDALIVCKRNRFAEVLTGLEAIGFQESPFENIPEDRPLRVGAIVYQRKHWLLHIHLTNSGSSDHRDILFFRNYLCANREAAKSYARIKREAVARGRVEATEYNNEKAGFILRILKKQGEEK
jgi:GrpB-like predicted nucleotidyltransferase (UPF0157 family)